MNSERWRLLRHRALARSVVDNALNFAGHGLAVVGALGVGALLTRRWRFVAAGAGLAGVVTAILQRGAGYRLRPRDLCAEDLGRTPLRVMTANCCWKDGAIAGRLAPLGETRTVDVLLLQEWGVAPADDGPLSRAFPYVATREPRGTQIYSRYPVTLVASHPTVGFGGQEPILEADVEHPAGTVRVIAVHALQPVHPDRYEVRACEYEQIAQIVEAAREQTLRPIVVAGDFNATLHSPAFQRLLRRTGLRSVSSWPPVSTWPTRLGAFGLAIDHVLVQGLDATSCRPGPDVGSDHRPLIACLCVEEPV